MNKKNGWMSKLNGMLFSHRILSSLCTYRERIFIANRDLYRKMENLEKEFENKVEQTNNKVLKLVETGSVKKSAGFQLKRLNNESEKSNISIFVYFILLTVYAYVTC